MRCGAKQARPQSGTRHTLVTDNGEEEGHAEVSDGATVGQSRSPIFFAQLRHGGRGRSQWAGLSSSMEKGPASPVVFGIRPTSCHVKHVPSTHQNATYPLWHRPVAPSTRQNATYPIWYRPLRPAHTRTRLVRYGIGLCYIKNTNNPNESRALPYNTCITINLRVQALRCRVRWSGSAEPARAVTDDARAAR